MSALLRTLAGLVLGVALLAGRPAVASAAPQQAPGGTATEAAASLGFDLGAGLDELEGLGGEDAAAPEEGRLNTAVEIAVLLTVLSLLPAILITITSFTRIVIVLSFVRRALGVNELPPNPVIIGLALFLTTFVMAPVAERIYERAWVPYQDGTLAAEDAGEEAWGELRTFLVANTRESELELFAEDEALRGGLQQMHQAGQGVDILAVDLDEFQVCIRLGSYGRVRGLDQ